MTKLAHFPRALILAAGLALVGLPALSAAQAKVLAKVDGAEITQDDVQTALEDLGSALPPQMDPAQREAYVLDYLIDAKLVARQAEKDKFGAGAEFERRMSYYRDKVMMEGLLAKIAKDAGTEAGMRKVYDEAKAAQKSEEEVNARHILVETEDEAKKVADRLKKGEDFAKLADEVSKDPGSKGGELGWFTKDKMVPEFADAAFKLDKGKVSEPVKSQFGWHVIRLEDRRQKAFPDFDAVKDQLARFVVQKSQAELITKLREQAKVERLDKPAEAPKVDAPKADAPAQPKK